MLAAGWLTCSPDGTPLGGKHMPGGPIGRRGACNWCGCHSLALHLRHRCLPTRKARDHEWVPATATQIGLGRSNCRSVRNALFARAQGWPCLAFQLAQGLHAALATAQQDWQATGGVVNKAFSSSIAVLKVTVIFYHSSTPFLASGRHFRAPYHQSGGRLAFQTLRYITLFY